jgi:spermidine/putrescine transport system substrate-binding protein
MMGQRSSKVQSGERFFGNLNLFRFAPALFFGMGILLSSCNSKPQGAQGSGAASDSSKIETTGEKSKGAGGVVHLAIWSNYISPEVLAEFKAKTGIEVKVSNYSSNEELLAKLQAGATGYDVIVPSDYMIHAMIELGLLTPLNLDLLPNRKGLNARFLREPINGQVHSLPYDWGTTGIAYRKDKVKSPIRSWKDLLDNPANAQRFTLLDDARETIGATLKSLGYSLNSTDPAQLAAAKNRLLQIRKNVKGFSSEPLMSLVSGETAIAHAYVSDSLQARKRTDGKVEYLLPEEGCTVWVDHLAIPKTAAHAEAAHLFINYLLEPRTVVNTVRSVFVSPANSDALTLLAEEVRTTPVLFPTEAMLSKCEAMKDLGPALTQWDRIWTEVKATHD